MKKVKSLAFGLIAALWLGLSFCAWLTPSEEFSLTERRKLAQFPAISLENVESGKFSADFETYSQDQFPLREPFRKLKALFVYKIMGQSDNNGIYLEDGYAAKLETLNPDSVDYAAGRFQAVYDKYLKDQGSAVVMAVVPDKSCYMNVPGMDAAAMQAQLAEAMPWAVHMDLTDCLTLEDYYRTDTHWRQENLLGAAEKLCQGLGVTLADDFVSVTLDQPFYGVYYGQAALPMEPDSLVYLTSDWLADCTVYDYETDATGGIYDFSETNDLYDTFLSGAKSLLTIENPGAATDRELIVFRDSFGSSLVPLLIRDYARVTLVDIRYMNLEILDRFVEFKGQDVLFLYSTLVLNNSSTIK